MVVVLTTNEVMLAFIHQKSAKKCPGEKLKYGKSGGPFAKLILSTILLLQLQCWIITTVIPERLSVTWWSHSMHWLSQMTNVQKTGASKCYAL